MAPEFDTIHHAAKRASGSSAPPTMTHQRRDASARRPPESPPLPVPATENPKLLENWYAEAAAPLWGAAARRERTLEGIRIGCLGVLRLEQRVERVVDLILARDVTAGDEDRADDREH